MIHSLSLLISLPWLDYNTRVVLAGTVLLGVCCGVIGTWMLLRKRSLVGDVASHAALPGVGFAYLWLEAGWPGSGRWLPGLYVGAACSAGLGLLCSQFLGRVRKIRDDAALAITLSLFFGLGVVLFGLIQGLPTAQAAGLSEFVFGKAAALVARDVWWMAWAAGLVIATSVVCHKEFALLCFDREYADVGGWRTSRLDLLLTLLVIIVTVIGMSSVGLLLIVALMVLPAAAAQFWTRRLTTRLWVAAGLGGVSAGLGVMLSAAIPKLAAGAVIVLVATAGFVVSLLFGPAHGWLGVWRARRRMERRIGIDDLLRACVELIEPRLSPNAGPEALSEVPLTREELSQARHWKRARLEQLLDWGIYGGWLRHDAGGRYRLTTDGRRDAIRTVYRHRLWERYLIEQTDQPALRVDRSVDASEHWVPLEVIEELERRAAQSSLWPLPANPHPDHPVDLATPAGGRRDA